jgi:hypothetical protein
MEVPPKHWYPPTRLHNVTTQKKTICITPNMQTHSLTFTHTIKKMGNDNLKGKIMNNNNNNNISMPNTGKRTVYKKTR